MIIFAITLPKKIIWKFAYFKKIKESNIDLQNGNKKCNQ